MEVFRGVPGIPTVLDTQKAPVKTGLESRMKEPYREGLAPHPGPQSCAGSREVSGEALARVHAGRVSSSEIRRSVCRPCWVTGKATRRFALGASGPAALRSHRP
jgi:hypothetical protein